MSKKFDLIVFGATGFTGSLICEYLSNHKDAKSLRWAVSGRNKEKLEELSTKYSVDTIISDSFNRESLNKMCSQGTLIISTVGPYDIYGKMLVKACIDNGTHYLDLTGEPSFVKKIHDSYSQLAKKGGVILMHSCGFESIPPDLGAYLTVKKLNSDNTDLTYYIKTKGKISGGTWASFINSVTKHEPIIQKNSSTSSKRKYKKLYYSHRFKKWALFFPVIDKYIVMKSSRSLKEYGSNISFNEYILLPSLSSAVILIFGIACVGVLSKFKFFKKILLNYIPSGNGPSKEEREGHWFEVTVVGKSNRKEVTTILRGGDPGYGETSKFISEMALCILLQKDQLIKDSGILTPVECTGELMVDRLQNAGITIEVSNINTSNEES